MLKLKSKLKEILSDYVTKYVVFLFSNWSIYLTKMIINIIFDEQVNSIKYI